MVYIVFSEKQNPSGFQNIFFINFKAQQSPPPSVGLLLILWGLFFYGIYDFSEKQALAQSLSPVGLRGGWSYNMVYYDFSEKK